MLKINYLILFVLLFGKVIAQQNLNIHPDLIPHLDLKLAPFYHGVASGDPTENSVVIWTKLTLDKAIHQTDVEWEIALDSAFSNILQKGKFEADESHFFTVKINIEQLQPYTSYYYRFKHNNTYSIVGQTKTLNSKSEHCKLAFASCSNYEWGYFNNYKFIAEDKSIDLVVHLGDYIYEYAVGKYGDTTIGRINIPHHEIVTLDDYRTRYSLYRLDKDLMKLHQMKPMITTWDDHEIANNSYMDGAQNHQPKEEGDWYKRKANATKAYYEWMPMSKKADQHLYRSFELGNFVNLILLDTRIDGRTEQVDSMEATNYFDTTRSILGEKQYNWLSKELKKPFKWYIIGNQVPFGPLYSSTEKKGEKYMDGWDGYPYEREKLIHFIEQEKIENVVFVTGDYHCSFALENDIEGTESTNDNSSVEFVVTSITSANDDEYEEEKMTEKYKQYFLNNNPHMKYCNNIDHGYLTLTISGEEVIAAFIYAEIVKKPTNIKRIEKQFEVKSGVSVVEEIR